MQFTPQRPYAVQITDTDNETSGCTVIGEHPFKDRESAEEWAGIFNTLFEDSSEYSIFQATVL